MFKHEAYAPVTPLTPEAQMARTKGTLNSLMAVATYLGATEAVPESITEFILAEYFGRYAHLLTLFSRRDFALLTPALAEASEACAVDVLSAIDAMDKEASVAPLKKLRLESSVLLLLSLRPLS